MTSGKQRRGEIKAARLRRAESRATRESGDGLTIALPGTVPCNPENLKPYNSYGVPDFVARGYYLDAPFRCATCGMQEVWRATQQKWWYEVAKGNVESRAKLCHACRRAERERRDEARQVHLEGLAAKRPRP